MLKNYVTVALRGFARHKLYSFINVIGLAVGLASCILILLFVRDELSYDRWLPDAERIYRLHVRYDFPGRAPLLITSSAGASLKPLLTDYADVMETGVRALSLTPTLRRDDKLFYERGVFVDPTFFDVFDLPLVAGEKAEALKDPSAIVMSETTARKYFGDANPLGQTLTLKTANFEKDVRVTAVLKDLPTNSNLKIGYLVVLSESDFVNNPGMFTSWSNQSLHTYVKAKPGADVEALAPTMQTFMGRHTDQKYMSVSLMRLTDLHLNAINGYSASAVNTGSQTVKAFSAVAVLILVIACINFVNLATARASQRAREVALRKVMGANRRQLITQFIGESVMTALVALVLALGLVEAVLPQVNGFLDKTLHVGYFGAESLLPYLVGLIACVGLLGGAYPAFHLSRFEPARILKANRSAAAEGSGRLRGLLVVIQFSISIALIVCTVVVERQTDYMRSMDMGFKREGLMALRGMSRREVIPLIETLKQEMSKIPGVTDVALSATVPTDGSNNEEMVRRPGDPEGRTINVRPVDYGFFKTYQTPIFSGRELSQSYGGDDFTGTSEEKAARGGNALINRKAAKVLGFANPADAIGQKLEFDTGRDKPTASLTIVGVSDDIQFRSARDELPATLFFYDFKRFSVLSVRYTGITNADMALAAEAVWRRLVPDVPFNGEFLTDLVDNQYRAEDRQGVMFTGFSVLAVLVACLGLFGLASFTAERRTKEIGIRKVMGAGMSDIVKLLAWDFSKPVLIANVIAWPAAWWLMRDWLNGFEIQIELSPMVFAAAGLAALAIALVTVALHTMRVARANPIHALRYE
ncbi:MAG: ABC transporter permease [Rhodospirillaceae bacterium]|nr:ABC transporter permease [Rhodospirillaceae bacterium]